MATVVKVTEKFTLEAWDWRPPSAESEEFQSEIHCYRPDSKGKYPDSHTEGSLLGWLETGRQDKDFLIKKPGSALVSHFPDLDGKTWKSRVEALDAIAGLLGVSVEDEQLNFKLS